MKLLLRLGGCCVALLYDHHDVIALDAMTAGGIVPLGDGMHGISG